MFIDKPHSLYALQTWNEASLVLYGQRLLAEGEHGLVQPHQLNILESGGLESVEQVQ